MLPPPLPAAPVAAFLATYTAFFFIHLWFAFPSFALRRLLPSLRGSSYRVLCYISPAMCHHLPAVQHTMPCPAWFARTRARSSPYPFYALLCAHAAYIPPPCYMRGSLLLRAVYAAHCALRTCHTNARLLHAIAGGFYRLAMACMYISPRAAFLPVLLTGSSRHARCRQPLRVLDAAVILTNVTAFCLVWLVLRYCAGYARCCSATTFAMPLPCGSFVPTAQRLLPLPASALLDRFVSAGTCTPYARCYHRVYAASGCLPARPAPPRCAHMPV